MLYLDALISILDEAWIAPTALLFALATLEAERNWIRARRRRGFRYSPLSHMLDALIVLMTLVGLAAAARRIHIINLTALSSFLAPLLWLVGLMLILIIGILLIRRFGPATEHASTPTQRR